MSSIIGKSDIVSKVPLSNGTPINFYISFDAPLNNEVYQSFKIIDKLAEGITFDEYNTFIKVGDSVIPNWNFEYSESNRILAINIYNSDFTAGKNIQTTVATKLIDKDKINKETLTLTNAAEVLVNENLSLVTVSSEVKVEFKEVEDGEIIVSPGSQNQIIQSVKDNKASFSVWFNTVNYDSDHEKYNVITTLPEGMTFVEEDSSVILEEKTNNSLRVINEKFNAESSENLKLEVTYSYEKATRKLLITINNLPEFYGDKIDVKIATRIEDESKDKITFKVQLGFNNDPSKISDTKDIVVDFIELLSIAETVDSSSKMLKNGTPILYTATFKVPDNTGSINYAIFKITDNLPNGLAFDLKGSSVKTSDGISLEGNISYPKDGDTGLIVIEFKNYSSLKGKNVLVNIATFLENKDKLPDDLTILNQVGLIINGEISSEILSKAVKVKFLTQEDLDRQQALTNVIESVSLVEQGLASILYAEGDNIKIAKKLGEDIDDIIKVNKSVDDITSSITMLEQLLIKKLKIANT